MDVSKGFQNNTFWNTLLVCIYVPKKFVTMILIKYVLMVPKYICDNNWVDTWWRKVCNHRPEDSENEDKNARKTSTSDGPSNTNAIKGLTRLLRNPCKQNY